jgi:hypothetical protein
MWLAERLELFIHYISSDDQVRDYGIWGWGVYFDFSWAWVVTFSQQSMMIARKSYFARSPIKPTWAWTEQALRCFTLRQLTVCLCNHRYLSCIRIWRNECRFLSLVLASWLNILQYFNITRCFSSDQSWHLSHQVINLIQLLLLAVVLYRLVQHDRFIQYHDSLLILLHQLIQMWLHQ